MNKWITEKVCRKCAEKIKMIISTILLSEQHERSDLVRPRL